MHPCTGTRSLTAMAHRIQVTFDAGDTQALGRFWAVALGYVEQPPPDGYDSWEAWATDLGIPEDEWDTSYAIIDPEGDGPRIFFQKVPEGKSAKNRVHLDVKAGGGRGTPVAERRRNVDAHVQRLTAAGGTVLEVFEPSGNRGDGYWVVMHDPEGNEFCVE